ncbi:MAG: AMP-binding protein [Actinomycetota bacterium]|nr:AMP-binding protein [Actinomycetota bacterium]
MEFNLARAIAAVAEAHPDRTALIHRRKEVSFPDFVGRYRRLGSALDAAGLSCRKERSELAGHESGQDHIALYLNNEFEYLESMLGGWAARAATFNVNHRYMADELCHLLTDSEAKAVVVNSAYAPNLAEVLPQLPNIELIVQVPDESGNPLLKGAIYYNDFIQSHEPKDLNDCSPDDLYVLYTGGTTGLPKGVLWRNADFFVGALGGFNRKENREYDSYAEIADAADRGTLRWMTSAPFMHGAAQWIALQALSMGHTVVLPDITDRYDATSVLEVCEREDVDFLQIVGDAFARPLLDASKFGQLIPRSLRSIISGGAVLNAELKEELKQQFGGLTIRDSIGSSETGVQGSNVSTKTERASTGDFEPAAGSAVVNSEMDAVLEAGSDEIGWFAMSGRVPLGYLNDAEKTQRTFPVIEGVRFSVPGDRARLLEDRRIQVLGRDSVTINSGGEKIFAEEVENAVKTHPAVYDVVVCGRPSPRWGTEVVAIVQLVERAKALESDIIEHCGDYIARYKRPKAIVEVDQIKRSPAGKPDYRWAQTIARESRTV